MSRSTAPYVPGIPAEHQPATGSAPGWPLVLYFHHVHPDVRHYTALTPREFEQGLARVLEDFAPYDPSALTAGPAPLRPDRPTVLVTFDDGYRDNVVYAAPILDRLGVRAVFFVCTGLLGHRSEQPRQDQLSHDECDRLAAAGHLIGAHTRTHPHLDRSPEHLVREETLGSVSDVAARYGPGPARLFAYPYGGIPDPPAPLAADALAFGTVRSAAAPWTAAPHAIRRTYLPSGTVEVWDGLVDHWREGWTGVPTAPPSDSARPEGGTP